MSDTPIFDSLIDNFHDQGIFPPLDLSEVSEPDPEATQVMERIFEKELDEVIDTNTPSVDLEVHKNVEPAGSKNTLYDASKLALIKPAIPEFDKTATFVHDHTQPMNIVKDFGVPMEQAAKGLTKLGEALRQADEELGLTEFDEAFEVAARELEPRPSAIVTLPGTMSKAQAEEFKKNLEDATIKVEHVIPITKNNVTPIKRGYRLPRRKNVRSGGVKPKTESNQNDPTTTFSFFKTDTTSSPGSAA